MLLRARVCGSLCLRYICLHISNLGCIFEAFKTKEHRNPPLDRLEGFSSSGLVMSDDIGAVGVAFPLAGLQSLSVRNLAFSVLAVGLRA